MSAEFDQLVAKFEEFQAGLKNVDDRLANIGDMQAEIGELEATASSPDRSVTVVAGPGGSVKEIRLTEEAMRQRPQALSAALMQTLQAAVAESARKQAVIVDAHMGGELGATERVLETQAELFGTTPEALRSKLAEEEPAPARRPRDEHEDFSEQTFLSATDEPQRPGPSQSGGGSQGDAFLKNLFEEDDR
ncbi:YbaB/EbfC family nucleoid-associated protein [Amycolatopsis sp. YIM 10]|uniref:YbaB/EbfC family nucleoid-associated protein n=1 Tax=Amycolatopsis sp. YIM 10 TaxID=2653857 RepID=UPI0012901374|nr:YbaB/EbfC family nucleoid-associated protein [Amycolatopsis sp. YIM 10]QFU94008.1 Nucleoid-associated protein YbaB [Amycolatopsis sp. YIM 10]